jgi:hypothetical protein
MLLKNINNSICSLCYSENIEKRYTNAEKSWANNYQLYIKSKDDSEQWIINFLFLLDNVVKKTPNPNHFRWFPSGDLESIEMLGRICEIANRRKSISFWLPSKQIDIISEYVAFNKLPNNLNIRVSSYMIDQDPPKLAMGLTTSTVNKNSNNQKINCPATFKIGKSKDGKCNDCKLCWNKNVLNIDYKLH